MSATEQKPRSAEFEARAQHMVEEAYEKRVFTYTRDIEIAGDRNAGVLLSQIIYWHGDSPDGKPRCSARYGGETWLARADKDWWREVCLTPSQVRRARNILTDDTDGAPLVYAEAHRWKGVPKMYYRPNWTEIARRKNVYRQRLETEARAKLDSDDSVNCATEHPDLSHSTSRIESEDKSGIESEDKSITEYSTESSSSSSPEHSSSQDNVGIPDVPDTAEAVKDDDDEFSFSSLTEYLPDIETLYASFQPPDAVKEKPYGSEETDARRLLELCRADTDAAKTARDALVYMSLPDVKARQGGGGFDAPFAYLLRLVESPRFYHHKAWKNRKKSSSKDPYGGVWTLADDNDVADKARQLLPDWLQLLDVEVGDMDLVSAYRTVEESRQLGIEGYKDKPLDKAFANHLAGVLVNWYGIAEEDIYTAAHEAQARQRRARLEMSVETADAAR